MNRYLRAANVNDGSLDLADIKEMDFSPAEQAIFSLRPGDVLVTEGSGSLGAVGATAVYHAELDGTVCFQNTLLRLRPKSPAIDPRFLAWWARGAYESGAFAAIATGANIHHLGADGVKSMALPLPDRQQQRYVADYLDRETRRIDTLVAQQRRLAALIEERFLAQIADEVSGRLREAGDTRATLPWLGSLASDRVVCKLGVRYEVQLGKMLNPKASAGSDLRPYLRNVNVQWDQIHVEDLHEMSFTGQDRITYALREGDLLVCEGGDVGRAAVWEGPLSDCYYQKALHRVRPRDPSTDLPRFLLYVLRTAADRGLFSATGNVSTIAHLTAEQLRAHRFPFPPVDEQHRVVETLDHAKQTKDNLVAAVTKQIELLQERRAALITAAVTGQLEAGSAA